MKIAQSPRRKTNSLFCWGELRGGSNLWRLEGGGVSSLPFLRKGVVIITPNFVNGEHKFLETSTYQGRITMLATHLLSLLPFGLFLGDASSVVTFSISSSFITI